MEGQRHGRVARCDIQGSPCRLTAIVRLFIPLTFPSFDPSGTISQAIQALVDPGDPVLIEKPVYAYAGIRTCHCHFPLKS